MFWDIFEKLCRQRGSSPTAVSLELGFSNATATKWKKGSTPQGATLQKIAEYFDVPIDFLVGKPTIAKITHAGQDSPFISEEFLAKFVNGDVTISIVESPSAEQEKKELWDKICRLSMENRAKVDGYVTALLDEQYREEIAKSKNA